MLDLSRTTLETVESLVNKCLCSNFPPAYISTYEWIILSSCTTNSYVFYINLTLAHDLLISLSPSPLPSLPLSPTHTAPFVPMTPDNRQFLRYSENQCSARLRVSCRASETWRLAVWGWPVFTTSAWPGATSSSHLHAALLLQPRGPPLTCLSFYTSLSPVSPFIPVCYTNGCGS